MKVSARNLIASLEAAPVGDGDLLGQPFLCLPYQRKFLQGAFRPGVMRAGGGLRESLCLVESCRCPRRQDGCRAERQAQGADDR